MSSRTKTLIALNILLMVYSASGIFSKLAAQQSFLSWQFVGCYAVIIGLLGIYAIGWQQIIKRLPLTTAYANRAVAVVWGIIWGFLIFGEGVTMAKLIGAAVVIMGVILFARADGADLQAEEERMDG